MNETFSQFLDTLETVGPRFLAALIAGALIGIEREVYEKPAGLRTSMLVTMGSALLTMVSLISAKKFGGDPLRITAQIVTGIGFIGGGVILHRSGSISGITSAATIFMCAAIGIAAGSGYVYLAVTAAVIVFVVLLLLKPLDRFIESNPYAVELRARAKAIDERSRKRDELAESLTEGGYFRHGDQPEKGDEDRDASR